MIRFGLRLAVAGGREAVTRLIVIAAAIGVGVGLFLTTLAGINAVHSQNDRYTWLNTGVAENTAQTSKDSMWWALRGDYFHGDSVGKIDVAATGPDAPVLPGMSKLPGPGEFYASPALSELLKSTPADELGDRYQGKQIGILGDAALPSPDSLIIVMGRTPEELSHDPYAVEKHGVMSISPEHCDDGCYVGIPGDGIALLLAVVGGALLFPLLLFVGSATRLSATRREERFAAMRLVAATPRQVSALSAVEAAVSSVLGTAIGFGLFFLFRDWLAAIDFTGSRFFPYDLALHSVNVLSVAIGVPVASAATALLALRRVRISPLGVTRKVTPRPPGAWRLIPVGLGLAWLTYLLDHRPRTTPEQIQSFVGGLMVVMLGLVLAGPWLTQLGARIMIRLSRRPATLIAARRMADNPKAGFRAVAGLVLALFVTTTATGVINTIVEERWTPTVGTRATSLINIFMPALPGDSQVPDGLRSISGVKGVAIIHEAPPGVEPPGWDDPNVYRPNTLVLCSQIAQTPDFGHCPQGAEVAWAYTDLMGPETGQPVTWLAAEVTPETLKTLPQVSLVTATDGSSVTIEKARTWLEKLYPQHRFPNTDAEWQEDNARTINGWRQLANVVILASLVIAGSSLAVSVAGGINERKRPFSLLRLTGVPLAVLCRVVTLESAVPLLAAAALAIGTGLLSAHLFLKAQMHYSVHSLGWSYAVIVAVGLIASLAIIVSTLPLLRRITGPETARND